MPENLLKNISGKISQVNISNGGVPKRPIVSGKLGTQGFKGDHFTHPGIHGGAEQAVLVIAVETIEDLVRQGYPVFPGALGENLTTRGLDPKSWRAGQQFRVGSARIELTKPRAPCRTLSRYNSGDGLLPIQKSIFDPKVKRGDVTSENWGKSGFYARVIQPGEIASEDAIVLESELA